jgi:hypothetical protein
MSEILSYILTIVMSLTNIKCDNITQNIHNCLIKVLYIFLVKLLKIIMVHLLTNFFDVHIRHILNIPE